MQCPVVLDSAQDGILLKQEIFQILFGFCHVDQRFQIFLGHFLALASCLLL
jgi:hypothetical protein